ncbi:MAG: tRNA (adenosine(37)-N6)-threonylcarbamoyltransferase complex dimerization subunit type 1 TsaB [Candidatus Omnitrophica bacterium]|nr:tRNA (adenosine(37)-N6)-threonylcarbamoyltransferase complex dimerization subunit type 1 TsaB [Candidatus Omnitrophota bacterium]
MKFISIETTSNFGSIAVVDNGRIKKEIFFESPDIAEQLVEKLNCVYEDFDYVIASVGPGWWTGIRIGLSFAKGLVAGRREKIYCVDIFESFFYSIRNINEKFLCIIPSSKEKFFYSEFKGNFKFGKFKIKEVSLSQLIKIIKEKEPILIGPGILSLKELIEVKKIKTLEFLWYPRASLNGILAYEKIIQKIPGLPPEPIYGK